MITLHRHLLLAFALAWLMLAGSIGPALARDALPRPAELEPAIDFWTRIYTEIPVDRGLIHDSSDPMTVYGEVPIAEPGEWRIRRQQVRAALDAYRQAFTSLAEQSMRAESALQARLLARLPENADGDTARATAERLRFQGGLRERFRQGLERSGRWRAHIEGILADAGLPPELVALPHVESSFNPVARSHAGAAGLWQFTVGTGREYMTVNRVVDERLDPWRSTEAAAALLTQNYERLQNWPIAVTAYNHGRNGMLRAIKAVGDRDYVRIRSEYTGSRFGFASRNFYPSLLAAADVDADAERYFADIERDAPVRPIRVELPHFTPMKTLLAGLDVELEALEALNPSLGPAVWDERKFIPKGFRLALPAGDEDWAGAVAALPGSGLYQGQRPDRQHAIAQGETLSEIANRYGVGVETLMASNGIANANQIRAGQQLRLPSAGAMPTPVGGRHYEVRPGDTLGAIAQRHGMATDDLKALNALDNPDRLQVGQELRIDGAPRVAAVDTGEDL